MRRAQLTAVMSESSVSGYRQRFFDLQEFDLGKVEASSVLYSDEEINPEYVILEEAYSFCYLREDKLKLLNVYDKQGRKIKPRDFLKRFGIKIRSKNLFKTGKYLSRVFRPVKYGGFYYDLDVKVNESVPAEYVDGISLISFRVAKALGWGDAEVNSSAQFTLFFNDGLVKGHCVVSDRIEHDVVIYGKRNIKEEIAFVKDGLAYISIEPVKLSGRLNLDIQTMLNLWGLFGAEQYLLWASYGITKFKKDLMTGKLNKWLQYKDGEEEGEQWVLRKAVNSGIDYRQYPALFRSAWAMFRNGIWKMAEGPGGEPTFRIPVPCGMRAYIRIDLREHDEEGNFTIDKIDEKITVDKLGNAWFGGKDFIEKLKILGGADQDDGIGIIPLERERAVIYRNPNQYGEYIIVPTEIETTEQCKGMQAKIKGKVKQKTVRLERKTSRAETVYPNQLVERFYRQYPARTETMQYVKYNTRNLLRAYVKIARNGANIGYAANAEMVLSAIGIKDKKLFEELKTRYEWNLEAIIDSTVKDGTSVDGEIDKITGFLREIVERQIPLPESVTDRLPQATKEEVAIDSNHELDMLLEALKFIIEQADIEVLGQGAVSSGNRVPGLIDTLDTPVEPFAFNDKDNPMYSMAMSLLYEYNRKLSELFESKTKEAVDVSKVKEIQLELLKKLNKFDHGSRLLIVNAMAYHIYKSHRRIHDSILWIGGMGNASGTADMMMDILLSYNGSYVNRSNDIKADLRLPTVKSVRIWDAEPIDTDIIKKGSCILTVIDGGKCIIDHMEFNIGDDSRGILPCGKYEISEVSYYRSKRSGRLSRNSVVLIVKANKAE